MRERPRPERVIRKSRVAKHYGCKCATHCGLIANGRSRSTKSSACADVLPRCWAKDEKPFVPSPHSPCGLHWVALGASKKICMRKCCGGLTLVHHIPAFREYDNKIHSERQTTKRGGGRGGPYLSMPSSESPPSLPLLSRSSSLSVSVRSITIGSDGAFSGAVSASGKKKETLVTRGAKEVHSVTVNNFILGPVHRITGPRCE